MKRARFKTLDDCTYFGEIPGLAGVWANETTVNACREVLQEVLEEWLILKIRDNDPIPRLPAAFEPRAEARARLRGAEVVNDGRNGQHEKVVQVKP
jgi:predicted RNase H-like HicB family nuclease